MPFNWLDYLQLAQTLAANGDEASKRTAISLVGRTISSSILLMLVQK